MVKKLLLFLIALCIGTVSYAKTAHSAPILPNISSIVLADSISIGNDTIEVEPSIMYIPIIFEYQKITSDTIPIVPFSLFPIASMNLNFDKEWLDDANKKLNFVENHMNRVIYQTPNLVRYNIAMLPEPPKQYVIKAEPNKITLTLEEYTIKPVEILPKESIKYKSWISHFNASIQFSQAYLSDNWYQGGNSNLNLLGKFIYSINLNTNMHPKYLFENTVQYKINLSSAPQDSLRSYSISEDLFQLNSKFGIKAVKNWFYTLTLQFKTQIFNNYTANTTDLKASFLTPGELNLGLGMTYDHTTNRNRAKFNVSIAPISYNMKTYRDYERMALKPTGAENASHIVNQIGSNIEAKMVWNISVNVSLSSRLYVFSNYEYVQGDFENTFNFSINKYLSTQLYLHLRYDSSTEIDPKWKYWQFKEILSFGFNYKF